MKGKIGKIRKKLKLMRKVIKRSKNGKDRQIEN